jgi:hypothetical protein
LKNWRTGVSTWTNLLWGKNYPKLLEIKPTYDATGLFFVRHGVGSEA